MDRTNQEHLPVTVVIFGASGDLTARKLIPALYHLHRKKRLPPQTQIVGVARRPFSDDTFRAHLRTGAETIGGGIPDAAAWDAFISSVHYVQGDLDKRDDYVALRGALETLETGTTRRLYYLAVAPRFYPTVVPHLGAAQLVHRENGHCNIIIEKPFGRDLQSARALNDLVHSVFREDQVYRIDHYLGKETAQNILFFRFANTIFEPIWNRRYVDNIQITVAETIDVGHRAGYYDASGVLRDMFQNHLMQLLSLIAMEPPASFNADALRNEKVKVLTAVRPIAMSDTICAQYEGYRAADGVVDGSQTPTYAAVKLHIDNWRWRGVPFYLRSGKALARKTSEIIIEFQRPPHVMFDFPDDHAITPNILHLRIQPDEGIHLTFETKVPDSSRMTRSVDMDFHYGESFQGEALPDAYERLLLDALKGDASLFARSDEIETAWGLMDPIIAGWQTEAAPPLSIYRRGSWGPPQADELLSRDERMWRISDGADNGSR